MKPKEHDRDRPVAWNRRAFLAASGAMFVGASAIAAPASTETVTILSDPSDPIVAAMPSQWGLDHLTAMLRGRGIVVRRGSLRTTTTLTGTTIVAAGGKHPFSQKQVTEAGLSLSEKPESLAIAVSNLGRNVTLLACGSDSRGLVFALTELADLVQYAPKPLAALQAYTSKAERPANAVRSLTRMFCSEVEDKPWFNDREMWPAYFDMLATQRFNRFNLAFGIGYDFIRKVTDAYFLFTYPFLLNVPGYNVRVPQLPDSERDRNLSMLKYIAAECIKRGLEFHVGLWMHGYVWIDSPNANYTIEGLNKTNHGPYCRDAVKLLLQEIPAISGVTFRIHGESGVEEGSFSFWETVFDGVKTCGRRVPLDMHTKGMNQHMIEIALATKQPVQMSPKYWGEHLGMPYHQADIRKLEKPKAEDRKGLMAMSDGTRSFLRYGYGDLLTDDRPWTVVHRIWPGTQRVLLWGDPVFAAGYSRAFSFCGSDGVEIQEMLSFKGRRGSGHAGDRSAYQDASYRVRWDWQKFEYGNRVWGRLLYSPETPASVLQRPLTAQFGPGAEPLASALGSVSRILAIVLTAHAPSAGNNTYWPELYLNQSMVDATHFGPYRDSPEPRVFGTTSPMDPELFYNVDQYAQDLLSGGLNGKYSPIEVASWIDDLVTEGRTGLAKAESSATGRGTGAYRRAKVDILIQAGLGEFFAAKLRSGVLFHLYQSTGDTAALDAAIAQYRVARDAWKAVATLSTGIYMSDITLGEEPQLRGHWADRLPAIDNDIAALTALREAKTEPSVRKDAGAAIKIVLNKPTRRIVEAQHLSPERFSPGQPLTLSLHTIESTSAVTLRLRHVDQAEDYQRASMAKEGDRFVATIPGSYTRSKFPLEYYFVMSSGNDRVLFPGFASELTNQPYFAVRGV